MDELEHLRTSWGRLVAGREFIVCKFRDAARDCHPQYEGLGNVAAVEESGLLRNTRMYQSVAKSLRKGVGLCVAGGGGLHGEVQGALTRVT